MLEPEFDLVSIGESMAAFVGREDPRLYHATPAGAEANVAVGMARLGLRSQWVSRLGDDHLGESVERWLRDGGVAVAVERDPVRPTGVLVKHIVESKSEVRYYRTGSAASRLSPADLARAGSARWIHVTGITPALSPSAAELVEAVVERRSHDSRVAFDVNFRPVLWGDAHTAAEVVLPLARRADLVFIGDDEALALFGTTRSSDLAGLILERDDQQLVLKRGAGAATLLTRSDLVSQPALPVNVVDVTGAGDAFAAGFLAATCRGWEPIARLRIGHVMASRVVGVIDDVPPPFEPGEMADLSPDRVATRWSGHLDGT